VSELTLELCNVTNKKTRLIKSLSIKF